MLEGIFLYTLVGTLLILAAAFSSVIAFRFGTPLLLLFLGVGLAAGVDGLGIAFDNAGIAYTVGSLALALILFDSGFGTPLRSFRVAAAPAVTLATVGVLLTALVFALPARYLLGLGWAEAALLGAIVSSTDAAAVFFLLRVGGITIREKVRSTLEIESGSNDPMAVFLTIAIAEYIRADPTQAAGLAVIAADLARQILIGAAGGAAGGALIVALARRVRLERGLLPIFVLALSLLIFSVTGYLGGSAFLAVYVAGLYSGNRDLPAPASIRRFQEGLTWLAQIVMFLILGLYATPSQFDQVALPALALAFFLILVARPAAVWLCLAPFRYTHRETAFVAWVGLRGAVSILLAIVPLLAGIPGANDFFNAAFMVVLVSLLVQGWTINPVARRLGLIVPARSGPVDKVELELPGAMNHELLVYRVLPDSPVANGERLPRWARPSLVVRGGRTMTFAQCGHLQVGDFVYLFATQRYPRLLDRLFAVPVPVGPEDADIYGEFAIDPDRPLAELAEAYGLRIAPGEEDSTIGGAMLQRLSGAAYPADRVAWGEVDLIVRETDEAGAIVKAGLSLTHQEDQIEIPPLRRGRDLLAQLRRRLRRGLPGRGLARPAPADKLRATIGGRAMTDFRTLDDAELAGKRVLLRVDLNVPMENGSVTDATRIERVVPTIREIAGKGGRVVLLAHFDRPKGKRVPEMSLKPVAQPLAAILGQPVGFADDCIGEEAAAAVGAMRDGDVVLLENTRYHAGEEGNDPQFVKALAANGDIYVNDAFSAAHRAHASTEGLAHVLPAFAGRAMQAELEALQAGLGQPRRPVIAIVGGAKVSTKIDLLENLVGRVQALVIGGGMANTFLHAQGVEVGRSLCEKDLAATALRIMAKADASGCAVILPVDVVVAAKFEAHAANHAYGLDGVPADGMILDAGPQSVERVRAAINDAATLVWNGPLGAFELPPFDHATVEAARHAAARTREGKLVSVAGGGDTVSALNHAGVADAFTYVSTAGGAFLEWMEGKELPGVAALRK